MAWRNFDKFPWSIPLGSLLRIPIRLHVTFFIVWIAQTLGSMYYGAWYVLLSLIMAGPVLLLTVLIHEIGHCQAARSVGGTAESILLWPLGGLAFIGYNTTYKKAIWVALAGPLTHIPMVAIWVALLVPAYHASTGSYHITLNMPTVDRSHFGHALCVWAIVLNIVLFVFNLVVPAYPLDGGRILTNGLMLAGCSMRTAAIVTVAFSVPIGIGIIVYGIVVFEMAVILVAVFILLSTFELLTAIRKDKLAEHPLFASVSTDGTGPAASVAGGGGAAVGMHPLSSNKFGTDGTNAAGGSSSGRYPGMPGSYYSIGNAV